VRTLKKDDPVPSARTVDAASALGEAGKSAADFAVDRTLSWTGDALHALNAHAPRGASGVELGSVLGEGGMGIVLAATQRALGRGVAVKTLRPESASDLAMSKLLREALVTGALEHPNIVPVYDLSLDERGTPLLVLKRISGVVWTDLLEDPALVRTRFAVSDPLDWNLRVFMQVANAVHFAHLRGIVHRDIKPDNVMVGEHGEVYVLDWGIAVALEDDGTNRFPIATASGDIAGTPFYMAPEMFTGGIPTTRMDVYLLGATLYHLVTGAPPHHGERMAGIIASAMSAPPPPPADAPEELAELAQIWTRAMAKDPAARHATADELRRAVQGFLEHRGSARLAERATRALGRLEDLLRGGAAPTSGERDVVYDTYLECAFGFRQALEEWTGNEAARVGYRRATRAMLDYELRHRDTRAARLLLAKLDPPEPAEEARVAALEAALAREAARSFELAELGRAFDPRAGARGRAMLLTVCGVLWVLVPLVVGQLSPGNPDYAALFPVPAGLLGILLVTAWFARRAMRRSVTNRAVLGAAVLAFATQMLLHFGSWMAGVSPDESQRILTLLWSAIAFMLGLTVAPRVALGGLAYLLGYLAISRWFAARYFVMAGANAMLMVSAWWEFRARPKPTR
jgi:serine/threonine-protein kinase